MTRIAVLGAGVIGASIAYYATRLGAQVTLVDRGPICELGASRWGFGGTSWASATSPGTITMASRGFKGYLHYVREFGNDAAFRACETMTLLPPGPALAEAGDRAAAFRDRGHRARVVDVEEAGQLEPLLALDRWAGALLCAQGHLDIPRHVRFLVDVALSTGRLDLREYTEVTGIEGDGSRLCTTGGDIEADAVVVAAGAWAYGLLSEHGAAPPVLHTVAEFLASDVAPPMFGRPISWGIGPRLTLEEQAADPEFAPLWVSRSLAADVFPPALEGGIVQFADGHVRVGQVSRVAALLPRQADPASKPLILENAVSVSPPVRDLRGLELHHRPVAFTPDHIPIAGWIESLPSVFLVATANSPVVMAPAIGEAVAAEIVHGRTEPAFEEWAPDRPALRDWLDASIGLPAGLSRA